MQTRHPENRRRSLAMMGYFIKVYPLRSAAILAAFVAAGAAEMLGIGVLLPLLSMVAHENGVVGESASVLERLIQGLLSFAGIAPDFVVLLALVVAAMVVKAAIVFVASTYVGYAAAQMADDMRVKLIRALMAARWHYYTGLSAGKMANIMATEAQRVGNCYTLIGKTLASFIQVAVYLGAAFLVSGTISFIALGAGIVLATVLRGLVRMAGRAGDDFTDSMNTMMVRLTEALAGAKPLKAMGLGARYAGLMEGDTGLVLESMKKQTLAGQLLQGAQDPLAAVAGAGIMYFAFVVLSMPLHNLMLLGLLFLRLMTSVNLVQNYYQKAVLNESALWAMQEAITEAQNAREVEAGTQRAALAREIRFDHVTLAHDGRTVLEDFSDAIPARKITVIFGPSGAGKTTLVDSVLGLNRPVSGEIYIDGAALRDVDLQHWRGRVGYVPQETFLFHDSIFNNITLGDPGIQEAAVIEALKESSAWDFVQAQPQGLRTITGERGSRLSGGQRQRIALARALVRRPDLLILDEATSGLDRENELAILETLSGLAGKMTVVAISHNPAILEIADHKILLGSADSIRQKKAVS